MSQLIFRTNAGDLLANAALGFAWTENAAEAAVFHLGRDIPDEYRGIDFADGDFIPTLPAPIGEKFCRWIELAALADDAFARAMSGSLDWPVAETRASDAADFWRSDLDHCATAGMRGARSRRIGRNIAAIAPDTGPVFIA